MFDWGRVKDFLEVLVIIWGFASGLIVLWLRGQFVTRKTYEAAISRLDQAIADCRSTSNNEANSLALQLSTLGGSLNGTLGRLDERDAAMKTEFGHLREAVNRIEVFLMNGKAA